MCWLQREAVAIGGGQVFYGANRLGRLALPEPPLSLPQVRTEALLERQLSLLSPGALRTGVTLLHMEQTAQSVHLFCGSGETLTTRLLVGCDGANSLVRALSGIERKGRTYPDRYLMGDFADDTEFGSDAALFFSREGIVESFPLPGQQRRWVARLHNGTTPLTINGLAALVLSRTTRRLPVATCSWLSPFGIEGYVADTFLQGRVALAGDAAHVVSPIGGQGMNLGILGAAALAHSWQGRPEPLESALAYHCRRANRVIRQAQFNTMMGRPMPRWSLRRTLLSAALAIPAVSGRFGRAFTMRDT
jgi:2-polyprenyl-6-methoxyphenol hydroxylase-like FAD-dependent oxidoreductase